MQNCHHIILLTYYSVNLYRTRTRFTADDNVVYQRMRRVMRLASDNSWAWRRMKYLSWRLRWIILCTLRWRMAVSCKISQAFWLVFLTEHKVLPCYATNARSPAAWLPDNCIRLEDSLKQTIDASNFPTIVGKFT